MLISPDVDLTLFITFITTCKTPKSTSVSVCFRGISRLPSAFVFLRWFKLAHISIQVQYVLSTMGVRKESISKFLIGNRFHVKLRILSPYSNRVYLNNLREIDFLLKICWWIPCLHPSWKVHTCKTSSIKIWFVLAAGLAENLTHVVFRQPFVIQYVRTRLLSCETWNFLFFIFFHHYIIN